MRVSIHPGARLALIATIAMLTACGGGGGGGGDSTPPPSSPPPTTPPPGTPPPGSPTNAAPTFGATAFSGAEDADLSGQLAATDPEGEALTFTKTGDPSQGTVTSFTPAGAFVYRPNGDVSGADTFTVSVADTAGNSANATVSITVTAVNDAPVAVNDVLRADGPQLSAIDLLGNDRDVDGDALTVTIDAAPQVGTATVGPDGRVRLENLPAGFRGLARFRYRITDGGGAFAAANAAVFVGTDPFRAVFAGQTGAPGAPEVYMTDFVSPPWRATLATEGARRLRGFVVSDNGATVAYRREGGGASDLSFVRTTTSDSTAAQQVRIALPSGYAPVLDPAGVDQFAVSPNGQWIATIARNGSPNGYAVFAVDVSAPTTVRNATPDGTEFASSPRFSANSARLYFLASQTAASNPRRSIYRYELGSDDEPVRLSRAYTGMNPGDVQVFDVSNDERRIALYGPRNGRDGVFFIDPSAPGTEVPLMHSLGIAEIVTGSTIGLPPGRGGSPGLTRIGYTARNFFGGTSAYVAEVGASPNARQVAGSGANAIAIRGDDKAMLFERSQQIYEAVIDSPGAEAVVGAGTFGVHDSVGDTIVLRQGSASSPTLAAVTRASFGVPLQIGTAGQAAWFADLGAVERAVVLIGEAPPGAAPATVRLALANARAPDRLLPLAEIDTPLDLTSTQAKIVTY